GQGVYPTYTDDRSRTEYTTRSSHLNTWSTASELGFKGRRYEVFDRLVVYGSHRAGHFSSLLSTVAHYDYLIENLHIGIHYHVDDGAGSDWHFFSQVPDEAKHECACVFRNGDR